MSEEVEPKRVKGSGVKFAYETLRDEILSLHLQPGAVLDETSLADRFGMSRSPVREALIRLAGDDLVVTLSNRSTVVAPIDIQSFPKYVEALDIAQRMNTRLAAELRTELDLKPSRGDKRNSWRPSTRVSTLRCPKPTWPFTWRSPMRAEIPIWPRSTNGC